MTKVQLSFALRANPTVEHVVAGRIGIEGVDLDISLVAPPDLFWRQLRYAEFDMSEMSMSSLLMTWVSGDDRWVPIPVFPERRFFHTRMVVHRQSEIGRPQDLVGKRIGVPDYQQTAALWTRGILQHDFGVTPSAVSWFGERTADLSHAGATGFTPPGNVVFQQIPPDTSQADLLRRHELDGSILYLSYPTMLDRTRGPIPLDIVRPLFEDVRAESSRCYGKWGFIPVNHCYVIKSEIAERHPWIVLNAFDAFVRAKRAYFDELERLVEPFHNVGLVDATGFRTDLYPYGVKSNVVMLDTLSQMAFEQGLIPRPADAKEMFAQATQLL